MPTTNSPKGSAIPVRPTPQMRQQLDELIAAGWGNQTDVIRTAIDRMHQQEMRNMNRYSKTHLQQEAFNAIGNALENRGEWFGMKGRSSQVIFAEGVLSVVDNGEGQDYDVQTEQAKAMDALVSDWTREQERG